MQPCNIATVATSAAFPRPLSEAPQCSTCPPTSLPAPLHRRGRAAPASSARPCRRPASSVLGVPLALTDYERTMDWMDATIAARRKGYICVAATHTVMVCQEDPELREAVLQRLDLDRARRPAARLGDERAGPRPRQPRLRPRADGPLLRARGADRHAHVPLRRAQPGRARPARAEPAPPLSPACRSSAATRRPSAPLTDEEEDASSTRSTAPGADVVWVGIGVPKQEKWMAAMRDRLDAPVLVGVGAAFDFHAGLVPQAPDWMQSAGPGVGLPPAPGAAPPVAALRALQPALRERVRAAVRAAPLRPTRRLAWAS